MVQEQKTDLGIVFYDDYTDISGLETLDLCCEELVLACSERNPLSQRETVALGELKNQQLILQPKWAYMYEFVTNMFRAEKIELPSCTIVNSLNNLSILMKQNVGVGIVRAGCMIHPGSVRTIRLAQKNRLHFALVWNKEKKLSSEALALKHALAEINKDQRVDR